MTFESLLEIYNDKIIYLKRIKNAFSDQYFSGASNMLFNLFESLKDETDFRPDIIRDNDKTFLSYRGEKYEIFVDDYGQAFYIELDGREFLAGSFTPLEIAVYDFCYAIDEKIHEKLLSE